MNSPALSSTAAAAAPLSKPVFYPLPGSKSRVRSLALAKMNIAQVEALLGGELEVIQLDAQHCLVTNAQAREQLLSKNLPASQLWFALHTQSGHGADFILGPVIHCTNAQLAHLNHLHAVPKPILTAQQRADQANERSRKAYDEGAYAPAEVAVELEQAATDEEARLACSIENPGGCEMCGS